MKNISNFRSGGLFALKSFVIAAVLASVGGCALAYEQPRYNVVRNYEAFEVRRYAPYIVAEATVSGGFEKVGEKAFGILAAYIAGNNRSKEKIPMTAPVNQSPVIDSGEKIAMTAPRIQKPQTRSQDTYLFSFVMPSKYTLDTLPRPADPLVSLRQVEGGLMAARTYSGTWSQDRYRKNEAALLRAVEAAGLTPVGAPVFARYNSPFSLWFLRRNEVLVQIKAEDAHQPDAAGDAPQAPRP